MSDIKMSDIFVLPVASHNGDLFNSKNPISDTRICKVYNMNQFKASKAAAHAINSHDKLTEQNKMLRDAIKTACDNTSKIGCNGVVTMNIKDFNALVYAYNECTNEH